MRALAASAAMGIQVGAAMVATRAVIHDAGPATLALWRYLIGVACLLPAFGPALVRIAWRRRDLAAIAALGAAQFGLLIAVLNAGLAHIAAGPAALLFATFPLMTLALAAAAGHERLGGAKLAGILLSVAGVGLTIGVPAAGFSAVGATLVLGAALIGAGCSVLYRPILRRYPAGPVSTLAMLAAVAVLAAYAAGEERLLAAPPSFTPWGWAAVAFIGVGSGLTYFLLLWALGRAPASVVTAFIALGPLTAGLLDGTLWHPAALAGCACVGGGLVLAAVTPRRG